MENAIKAQAPEFTEGTYSYVSSCRAPAVKVAPRISSQIRGFLSNSELLFDAVRSYGSPLNILFPEVVPVNSAAFKKVFESQLIDGEIICTSKPNKSVALMRALAVSGSRVDVSSEGALSHALRCGIPGKRIHTSGPKGVGYLYLAVQHETTISIDSVAELTQLASILAVSPSDSRARIVLRLAPKRNSTDSVFGISAEDLSSVFALLDRQREKIHLEGVHYHLHAASDKERVGAFEFAFNAFIEAKHRRFKPNTINIGGGFKIRYAESTNEWNRFEEELRSSVFGTSPPLTWNGSGLGFRSSIQGVAGSPTYQNHAEEMPGPEEFARVLSLPVDAFDGQSIGRLASDALIKLYVEPGRAIFDQAGLTVAQVHFTKRTPSGEFLVGLGMNQSNLGSYQQKLLTQPIFIYRERNTPMHEGAFLAGNLCTSNDIILQQKVFPEFIPSPGDLAIFCNTAPYLMDFMESEVLHQPVARKVAAIKVSGTWKVVLDDAYNPITEVIVQRCP